MYHRSVEKSVSGGTPDERSACEQVALLRHRKPERGFFNMPIIAKKILCRLSALELFFG
jgi:hypothetical protein